MIFITRKENFNAAHNLWNNKWSDEKNREVFGACANLHGHNFELEVTVKGEIDEDTGFVIDLKVLGNIIQQEIIEKIDHKYLNRDVDFMAGKLTSTENFAIEIWKILQPKIEGVSSAKLHSIKLQETAKNSVEYFG